MAKLSTIEKLEKLGYTRKDLDRQFREATKHGAKELKFAPRAIEASAKKGIVTVDLSTGWSFTFDPRKFRQFRDLTDAQIAEVKPLGLGFALEWPRLDLHLGVVGLIFDLIGQKFLDIEAARRRGGIKSEKKKVASRANGKLGGRPRKLI